MLPAKWPQWIIVPIAFLLVAAVTGLGLGLIKVAEATTRGMAVMATPTPPGIAYAGPLSTVCTDCHVDEVKLGESVGDEEELQRLYIPPADTQVLHGQLGCITCHRGTPDTEDIETAHTDLIVDPTIDAVEDCLYCHSDLQDAYPEDNLIAPHAMVLDGSAQNLYCSDCHGSVGHGYDPITGGVIISMGACLDCHEERRLRVQANNCEACHTEVPPWDSAMDCTVCHTLSSYALGSYTYEESRQNPDLLAYAHAQEQLQCSDCHDPAVLDETHKPPYAPFTVTRFEDDFCFDCHVENEHGSYEQIIERTADYVILGENINPHDPHPDKEKVGELPCYTCHLNHRESLPENGCFSSSCHHERTFEKCSTVGCHG
jgi:hypothetical protein